MTDAFDWPLPPSEEGVQSLDEIEAVFVRMLAAMEIAYWEHDEETFDEARKTALVLFRDLAERVRASAP